MLCLLDTTVPGNMQIWRAEGSEFNMDQTLFGVDPLYDALFGWLHMYNL